MCPSNETRCGTAATTGVTTRLSLHSSTVIFQDSPAFFFFSHKPNWLIKWNMVGTVTLHLSSPWWWHQSLQLLINCLEVKTVWLVPLSLSYHMRQETIVAILPCLNMFIPVVHYRTNSRVLTTSGKRINWNESGEERKLTPYVSLRARTYVLLKNFNLQNLK